MTATIRLADGYHYVVPMSKGAQRSLAWIADRYVSAAYLFDGSRRLPNALVVPEHVAHEYIRSLEEDEDGSPIVPPCAGGELADVLVDLWNAVV